MNKWTILIGVFVIVVVGAVVLIILPGKTTAPTVSHSDVRVESPLAHATITSPVTITGEAKGNYYFEASFPIEIRDESGSVVGQGHAEAQGDWMTENFVPFTATISFTSPGAGNIGSIRLKNDNPSGDPARDTYLDIPVQF